METFIRITDVKERRVAERYVNIILTGVGVPYNVEFISLDEIPDPF